VSEVFLLDCLVMELLEFGHLGDPLFFLFLQSEGSLVHLGKMGLDSFIKHLLPCFLGSSVSFLHFFSFSEFLVSEIFKLPVFHVANRSMCQESSLLLLVLCLHFFVLVLSLRVKLVIRSLPNFFILVFLSDVVGNIILKILTLDFTVLEHES
jgi:hypothetical protein